ncbi:hypothetical protein U1Q18_001553 [Sarracenia purpurea var. burkii]
MRSTQKNNSDILQWAMEVSMESNEKEWELFLMIIWCLWNNKNLYTFENKCRKPEDILSKATTLLSKFQQERLQTPVATMETSTNDKWTPPESGWHKVNVDGALRKNGMAGISGVIRDERGFGSCLLCGT